MAPLHAKARYPAVLDWAAWHYGVVSRRELEELGIPPGTIASWLVNGRLQRLHRACSRSATPRCDRRGGGARRS